MNLESQISDKIYNLVQKLYPITRSITGNGNRKTLSIINDIISGKVGNIETREAAAIALYSRYLKRIAAHSRNLISSVVNPFERIGYPEQN